MAVARGNDKASPPILPLCFVLMPFGVKAGSDGEEIDFDAIYEELMAPAVRDAGLSPLRADEELIGGLIHKPLYERLILVDYAIADLTTANPNVFYELGVRHAVRPHSTVLASAGTHRIPFDLAPDRVHPYSLDGRGALSALAKDRASLTKALRAARATTPDSPVFQLIDDFPQPDIDRLKTDTFRELAAYSSEIKERLEVARREGPESVRRLHRELGPLADVEVGVLVDLLISYRATEAWGDVIELVESMPEPVQRTVMVREQYGFALNRAERSADAERVLLELIDENGDRSETLGLLGRVYKDRWRAEPAGSMRGAGYLLQAIDAYRRGFEADWRDAYPGINALTLMEVAEPGGTAQQALAPVVRYSNRRRIGRRGADYWDHATTIELEVIADDQKAATAAAQAALALVREGWEPRSTAANLALLREARAAAGERRAWAEEIERELIAAAESR
jgi:hypothetical protein